MAEKKGKFETMCESCQANLVVRISPEDGGKTISIKCPKCGTKNLREAPSKEKINHLIAREFVGEALRNHGGMRMSDFIVNKEKPN